MPDCLFCKIARKELSASSIYEDDEVLAFHDIHPKYRVHVLLIPKMHVGSASELQAKHDVLVGKLLRIGGELARQLGIADSGFRLLTNTGPHAGQVIDHLHVHLLGGEILRPI